VWTMRFMNCLLRCLFSTAPIVMPLVACRMAALSSEFGYCSDNAMGYLAYSHAVLNVTQDVDACYQWARISLSFPERFDLSLLPKVKLFFYANMAFWKEPIQACCDIILKIKEDLLMVGDIESAVAAIFYHTRQSLFSGNELTAAEKVCSSGMAMMTQLSQLQSCLSHSSNHLIIVKLIGGVGTHHNPFAKLSGSFNGEINSEDDVLQHALSTGKTGVAQGIRFNRLFLSYWFKRYGEAAEMAEHYISRTLMPLVDTQYAFYSGLTAYQLARYPPSDPKWIAIGEKSLLLLKSWKSHSAWNWQNKFLLLEAECHFSKGEMEKAEVSYILAIESARRHKFVHEEGLGNELFSTFCATIGNVDKAKSHLLEAKACYKKWGAFALIDQLNSLEKQ